MYKKMIEKKNYVNLKKLIGENKTRKKGTFLKELKKLIQLFAIILKPHTLKAYYLVQQFQ